MPQEDSPGEASYLVSPSPSGSEGPTECKETPVTVECGRSTTSRVKEPPLASLQTVPETLACNLYDDSTNDELAECQPPLTLIAEEDGVRCSAQPSRETVCSETAGNKTYNFGEGETLAESQPKRDRAIVTDEHVDDAVDLMSQESPRLLQRGILAHPVQCESRVAIDNAPVANVELSVTPERPTSAKPHRQLFPVIDDKSPSLLDLFAVPKCVAAAPVPKRDVGLMCFKKPPANDTTTLRNEESGTKLQTQPSAVKLSLLRKRPMPAAGHCSPSTAQPLPTAKQKRQMRLSDRYFMSVNRSTVAATRSSCSRTKKKLLQTHVDTHFNDDSLLSLPERPVDPDETFVAPELLRDTKIHVLGSQSSPEDASPAAVAEGQDHVKPEDVHSAETSIVSTEFPVRYHNSPVRKKVARQQLPAHDCKECQEFYRRLALPEAQRKELLRKCSRHRALHSPPPTPDHFWEIDFPDTQVCRERGYLNATQKYVFSAKGLRKDDGDK